VGKLPNRSELSGKMFACEHSARQKEQNPRFNALFPAWHTECINVSMKRQLQYRTLTIAVGIVVALLIALTMFMQTDLPAPPQIDKSKGLSLAIKSAIQALPVIKASN
jgi:hypothetical protein